MGLFDSVYVPCPSCGEKHEFQSKAGDSYLNRYTLDDAPDVVLADIGGAQATCKCGLTFAIRTEVRWEVIPLTARAEEGSE